MSPDEQHPFLEGVRLFNEQRFFEAHEVWEEAWRPMAAGFKRELLQGLIQIAVGLEHARRGNPRGADKCLERAARRLTGVPRGLMGVDAEALLRDASGPTPPTITLAPTRG